MPSLSNNDLTITIKALDDASATLKQVQKEVSKTGQEAEEASPKTDKLSSKFQNFGRQITAVAAAFAGTQLIGTIESLASTAFASAGELEQTNASFQNLIGNVSQANQLFAGLATYANTTPFQMADVTGAAKQLLAFGQNAQQVSDTVRKLGDVTAAGGGDLKALSLVTGQVFAQGKMRAQDMYQVINDGGAGLIKIMADNVGGMQKLTALFDSGGIPAQAYFDAINQATANGGFAFQGAQKQAETFNGQMSTLKDAVANFGRELLGVHIDPQLGLVIDKGGLFDRAKGVIETITNGLSELAKHKTAVMAIAGAIGGLLLGSIVAVGAALIIAFGWIPLAIAAVATAVGAIVGVIIGHWKEWHRWILLIGAVIGAPLLPFIAAAVLIIKYWDDIKQFAGQALDWIMDKVNWLKDHWLEAIGMVIGFFATLPFKLPVYVFEAFAAILGFLASIDWGAVFAGIGRAIAGAASAIWNAIKWAFDKVTGLDWAGIMVGIGKGIANAIISLINGAIKGAFSGVPILKDHIPQIPHFASGTNFAPGGLAELGENGPELVVQRGVYNLPRGSQVLTASQTANAVGSRSPVVNIANVTVNNNADINRLARELGWRLAIA